MKTIGRSELRGIGPTQLILLYLNRANDFVITADQIKQGSVERNADGNAVVTLQPGDKTNWINGPIEVIIPPVQVDVIYGATATIEYPSIGELTRAQVLAAADLPPLAPTTVGVGDFAFNDDGPLTVSYRLTYNNYFFQGSIVVEIANAPNDLTVLAHLNQLFLDM
jgi:hypothetical protein